MSLLSSKDHDMVAEAIDFFLDSCDDLDSQTFREFSALRQWVLLQKSKLKSDA